MSSEPSSLETAFRRAAAGGAGLFGGEWDAERIDAMRDANGNLPRDAFRLIRQQQGEDRKAGRPKGAGNKRNQQLAKLITHKFGDPVEAMASLYAMPLDQMVELIRIADPGKDSKTGDIAIKALNVQLAAAKAVSEYVHSKKPVEANVNVRSDGVLVFPGGVAGSFDQLDDQSRQAAALIQGAVDTGQVSADMLAGMKLVDGQLVDAEWSEIDAEDAAE
ncbi:hypothetical protein [Novosphingobium huizhouense]|uniref:hypothetical protein n=1 Tax=Novosphingobium huizhouense TaxID=2866625 RepID=UPI001CD8F29C|nr:hypothetical protein [Novosphingobium huizhouense]